MNFSELQQSWQQQLAPATAGGRSAHPDSLLTEIQRLHRFGRRRNRLATLLLSLALLSLSVALLLPTEAPRSGPEVLGAWVLLIDITGFVLAMWWGTSLRRRRRPGLDTQQYLSASLRAFRFRAWLLTWLAYPYAGLLALGFTLLYWQRWHTAEHLWKAGALTALLLLAVTVGRSVGLRRYRREFGPTVRELEAWQAAWSETAAN